MRPILIDTNAYSAFKRGDDEISSIISHAEIIAMTPIVLGELAAGFALGKKNDQNRAELQQFMQSSRVRLYPVTSDTANFYAHIFKSLRAKGQPIPTNDIWIGALALEHGAVICTHDQHFEAIDGLIAGATLNVLVV